MKLSSIVVLKWYDSYLILIYLLVIVWSFVGLPCVNISTGELKPRGLFVDENALPLHFNVATISPKYNYHMVVDDLCLGQNESSSFDDKSVSLSCEHFQYQYNGPNVRKCDLNSLERRYKECSFKELVGRCQKYSTESNTSLVQVIIDPEYSTKPLEATLLVFRTRGHAHLSTIQSLNHNIALALHSARWMSKRVVILIVDEKSSSDGADMIDAWLR
jgi:hypothetical protein